VEKTSHEFNLEKKHGKDTAKKYLQKRERE
jgi:hypothetical protein